MLSSLSIKPTEIRRILDTRAMRVVRPVLLAGLATALLFASIDRSQPWSVGTAGMGILLLGAVLSRQLGEILQLERQLAGRVRQLAIVSEVVSTLNSSPNVGSSLGEALDRLVSALDAEAGAIWLPAPDDDRRMVLVEDRGLPDAHRHQELLEQAQVALSGGEPVVRHTLQVPDGNGGSHARRCLLVRMGREGEDFGRLIIVRASGEFGDGDLSILRAIGSDIGGALRSVRLISEARRLADRDPVTGLHNHRSVYQRLHSEVEKAGRSGKPMAVLMMDLDNFKLFNDTYGHPAGDEVLKRVSAILKRSCRDGDTVARYGGDEFMVVLPESNLKAAIRCAERIQAVLAKERFRCQNSATLPIGFSYGISVYPDDAKEVQELVAVADSNLYQSKTQGGNQITARGSSMTDNALVYVKGFDLFRAMVQSIDNKDGYTKRHSEEVTDYSVQIARGMGLSEDVVQTIQVAGILHDVGKIGVPDHILRKPGHLTDEEFHVMKQHPVFGARIVGAMPGMEEVVHGVRHHHERYDGRGYPDRLAGTDIPLIGRIMAVADAFSAMTTHRPYRKGMTERQALLEIKANLGTQFDPEIGEVFVQLREAASAARKAATPRAPRKPKVKPEAAPVEPLDTTGLILAEVVTAA
ncbi:MAG: diguanylate cyclase and metal dependent phosphohydrolase [Armatimonadetes bacterium]|nr:diguanylate cyclase and metal dependent phosphohydrolase [Armatimonadota bacterium]